MTLADTIHQVFEVGKGDVPTIEDADLIDRARMRKAALLESPDQIHEHFASRDLVAFNMAFALLVEKGALMPLSALCDDLLNHGDPCLDELINFRIEERWQLAAEDRRYGEPEDFDERRAKL